MKVELSFLFTGFPGKSNRGFLGWSSSVLLETEGKQPMLFDTAGFNERYQLIEKLEEKSIKPENIGTVFLSHFHFDHAVNFGLFPNASFYLHEKEVHHIERCKENDFDLAVPYEMYQALKETNRLNILQGEGGVIEGVEWLHTPGHTPGLYSLLIQKKGKTWALTSDAVKNRGELESEHVAMSLDDQASTNSIKKIKAQANIVIPGHDAPLELMREENGSVTIKQLGNPKVTIEGFSYSTVQFKTLN